VNALKAMILDLDLDRTAEGVLPHGSKDLGNGYVLLRAREAESCPLRDCEADALREFCNTSQVSVTCKEIVMLG
jgi:hypothetical protein